MDKERIIGKLTQSSKKKHLIVGSVLLTLIFLYLMFSDFGLITRFSLMYKKSTIEERIANELQDVEDLKRQKVNLIKDTIEIERTAREKYGYVKENETIYVIKSDDE
jgi:cell division protein FtsB